MRPAPILAALAALVLGLPARAADYVTLVNETREPWVLISETADRIAGQLTVTRTARDGAEGSGEDRRAEGCQTLGVRLGPSDAVRIRLDQPLAARTSTAIILMNPRQGLRQFWLDFALDARAVPAKAILVPQNSVFYPSRQDPYRLEASEDLGTVRVVDRRLEGVGDGKANHQHVSRIPKGDAGKAGPVEAKVPAGKADAKSAACAIL